MLNNTGFDLWADGYDKSVGLSDENDRYPFAGYRAMMNALYQRVDVYKRQVEHRLARFGHDLARDGFGARDERERAFNRKQADKPQCDHTPEKRHDPLRRFFEDNPQHEYRQNEPACADAEVHELQKDVIHDDSPFDKGRSLDVYKRQF